MAASFFEVFPVLKLNKGMMDLLEEATVEKVTASQARNRIRVYLCSPRLISYEEVRKLEDQIRGQLFENTDVHVDIIDRYELSEQYTPERLMSIYFDSFEAELKDSSDLEANIFHKAEKGIYRCAENGSSLWRIILLRLRKSSVFEASC